MYVTVFPRDSLNERRDLSFLPVESMGDPAQDMQNLLLALLLKKRLNEQKKKRLPIPRVGFPGDVNRCWATCFVRDTVP